jgi:hypothetical protein
MVTTEKSSKTTLCLSCMARPGYFARKAARAQRRAAILRRSGEMRLPPLMPSNAWGVTCKPRPPLLPLTLDRYRGLGLSG